MATSDFTIADVLAWARTKPADERYVYGDTANCAMCQFLRETDRCANPSVGGTFWTDEKAYKFGEHQLPVLLVAPLIYGRTFGELADLLAACAPEAPVTASDWLTIDAYLTDIEAVSA